MRLQILLISLLCLCFAVPAQENASVPSDSDLPEGSWVSLEGNNTIRMPSASFASPGANWTYPFPSFPVYVENQTISGSFLGPAGLAGREARVCISGFSIQNLLSALEILDNETPVVGNGTPIRLNETGDASFAIQGVPGGLYTITVADALNSTVLAATPALIAEGGIATEFPKEVTAGDMLQLGIETPPKWGNESRICGAIMVSSQDYATARLSLAANGTEEGLVSTITLCSNSTQVQGMPSISTDLLMKILYMLPQNSAIAMQESTEHSVELYLLTDPTWAKGEYVLTCAVYSPKKGLMGLQQGVVEVV
jgi:methanogen extracellular protein (TIGR04279 family)